ncbi:hypothetical protein [Novosphingobium resinovorum]|uniref:hypothetical protein n=1 Tax=Novosphingobium resinovorum TaxID=158500 RepID=UPI002ED09465|nr:hypothetical protein [Novosphingobium resinovorum]
MELTLIGAAELTLALALFAFGSMRALFALVIGSTLLGGSAAVYLGALGGSSISPAHFALGLLMLRCLIPGGIGVEGMVAALRANGWLVVFVAYGVVAALVLPRIFAGEIDVTPLRGQIRPRYGTEVARILAVEPLHFTAQNLTTAVYMIGTLAMALTTHAVLRGPGGARMLARCAAAIGTLHALTGFAGVALRGSPLEAVFLFLRNGSYAQMDHEWGGFVRMNGLWPEASSFAAFAVVWFVFNFECWLRRIEARRTGMAALLLGLALVASTSSTAYIGLALFAVIMVLRTATTPRLLPTDRVAWIAIATLSAIIAATTMMVLNPALAAAMRGLLEHMTLDKAGSFSGRQRLFWASQGPDAFLVSYGLGIGPGSFRSSSLASAILGSTGVIGVGAFLLHLGRAYAPLAASTFRRSGDTGRDTAAAAAWAMLVGVGVASVSAPSCDPGLTFAILSGAAIALRTGSPRAAKHAVPAMPTGLLQTA